MLVMTLSILAITHTFFYVATQTAATTTAPQKQQEPMFISVPPRPQRVFHSEAYIK